MPDTLGLGPFVLPLERLLAGALIWAFVAGSLWLARKECPRTKRTPWLALGIGIVAARVSFVASHWEAYRSDPATIAYFWQGGFEAVAGIIAALAVLVLVMGSLRRAAGPALLLAVVSGLWFGYLQLQARSPRALLPNGIQLADLNGRPVALNDLRGRPFVLNLWASWCGPCRREMPMFVEVAARRRDVTVLLVNQGEDQRKIQRFLIDGKLPAGQILSDTGASLMRLTGSAGLPTTLFVRADGRIEKAHIGELSRAALTEGMDELTRR